MKPGGILDHLSTIHAQENIVAGLSNEMEKLNGNLQTLQEHYNNLQAKISETEAKGKGKAMTSEEGTRVGEEKTEERIIREGDSKGEDSNGDSDSQHDDAKQSENEMRKAWNLEDHIKPS